MCKITDEIAEKRTFNIKIRIARNLLAEHLPIDTIIKVTELSTEKVRELAQQKSA